MPSDNSEPLKNEGSRTQVLISGAVAGLVSRFCIAPLDVIKIRQQLQYHTLVRQPISQEKQQQHVSTRPSPPNTGSVLGRTALQTLRNIYRTEGITGFWKGNVPAEALYLTYGSVQFLSYRSTTQALQALFDEDNRSFSSPSNKSWLKRHSSVVVSFTSGAMAGMAATTVTYPLDLLRTRFAAQGTNRVYGSLVAGVRDIYTHEGAGGFFRGLGAGVGQVVPYMGMFFSLYEVFKPFFAGTWLPLESLGSSEAVAGVLASVLSKTAVFPLDTVRKRLQVQGPTRGKYVYDNIPVYQDGVIGTTRAILAKEGVRGLYRGLSVGLIKAAPASAVTMWTYERTMKLLQATDEP